MTTRDEREGPAAGDPDVFLQHLTQGGELLAAGHTEEALGYLESALSLGPADEKAQNLLGLCCFKLGHLDRAAEIYEHLVRENPVDPTLRVNLGLVYLKANAVQRAVREFETATELAPDHRKAHNYLGLALAQGAEYGRAREHFLLAGSEHMAEKMGRALDGAGFEPVTTPAGGVAALDPSHVGSGPMPGGTPAPGFAGGQGPQQWDAAGAPMMGEGGEAAPSQEGWDAEPAWEMGAGADAEGGWDAQASWDQASGAGEPGEQGWVHPDDAAGWAHPEGQVADGQAWHLGPDAGEVRDGEPPEGGWHPDAGSALQPYGEAPEGGWPQDTGSELQPYGEPPEGGWLQDAGSELQPYGEAPEGGGWHQDPGSGLQPYGEAPEGGQWPEDAGSEQQPYGEAPEGAQWAQDAGSEQQPAGEAPEGAWAQDADADLRSYDSGADAGAWEGEPGSAPPAGGEDDGEGWPQDDGAELQPEAQQQRDDEVWPQDPGPELQPPSHPEPTDDGLHADQAVAAEPAQVEAAAESREAAGDVAPEATSALDDDLDSEPADAAAKRDRAETTPVTPEKVASLRPARLEDSWGAQFGLEGEGTESSEPAEELVVELNASEVADQGPEEDAVEAMDITVEPAAAPVARQPDATGGKGAPAAAETSSEARREARGERSEQEASSAREAPEVPGVNKWEERPGARSSGSGWLVELSRQLELRPGPSTEGFTELGDGVVDLQLRDGMRTRTHGYFALEGKVRLTPEPRRIRGRTTEQHFGAAGREMMRVQGSGHLLVRVSGRQLLSLELGEEGLFLREEAVYAFEENVMFENGSLSDPDGREALKLVHLRGTGRLLVELEGALRTVQIREGAPARVELSRIVGWFGELVPQAVAADTGLSAHLELSGQGFVLIDAAHREASP